MDESVIERIRSSVQRSIRDGAHSLSFRAMGTVCRVQFAAAPALADDYVAATLKWVADFEARYSRFLSDSLISRINQAAGLHWVELEKEDEQLFAMCHEAHFLTRGIFDPTALPVIQLWNWKANPPVVPNDAVIAEALKKVGWPRVQRAPGKIFLPEPGMSLDLGGIGKEYAVDRVARLAVERGVQSVLVDFGQDVFAFGTPSDGRPAWKIGLENPAQPGQCWTSLAIRNRAVATSGDYFRNFVKDGRRFGHILDVRTGRPVDNGVRAVSIVAPNCTVAGMLSTAAFVLGPDEGLKLIDSYFQAEGCLVLDQRKIPSRKFYEYVVREPQPKTELNYAKTTPQ